MFLLNLIFISYFGLTLGADNVTLISRKEVLLSRTKRYLIFPTGSNLAISMAGVKALLVSQPTGFNILGEMDCPFALPTDTRLLRKSSYLKKSKREIYSTLEKALTINGFDGKLCLRRMMCDAKKYIQMKGKSMIRDILLVVFDYPVEDFKNQNICTEDLEQKCTISIMEHVLQEINSNDGYN